MPPKQHTSIYKQIDSLPSLPATVSRVLAVTSDPESCGDDLVNAILPDQAMCAAILKVANSAFFGIPREVATMDKAVNVLGFNEVHNIVLGKAVFNSFQKIPPSSKHTVDTFWQHSFYCGLAAKVIAEDLNYPPSELFIAGLIHDIGKLAIFLTRPDEYLNILSQECLGSYVNSHEKEQEQLGLNHSVIGLHLLTRWMFPVQLLTMIGHHHHPEKCDNHKVHTTIIQLSDLLSILVADEENQPTDIYPQFTNLLPHGKTLWEQLNLTIDEEKLQQWRQDLLNSIEKDSAILNIFTS
jgi:putative nucleotidyltransferase with HDIG domain